MATRTKESPWRLWTGILAVMVIAAGLLFTLVSVQQQQITRQNASQDVFSSVAVQGTIYITKTGVIDNSIPKCDSAHRCPLPKVQLALFSTVCSPIQTPSFSVIPTPTPPPPSGCYYRKLCPMYACRMGASCPPCNPILVCQTPTPSSGPIPPQTVVITGKPIMPSAISTDIQDAQKIDVCERIPVRVINCPVGTDGSYACIVQNQQFVQGWVRIVPAGGYYATTENPVTIKSNTATVNFGIYSSFPIPY